MKVAIIGGGAAGFFAAISCKQQYPTAEVVLYEKSGKLLSKVRISGGGRCNVTNACFNISDLSRNYPRGGKQLKKLFSRFNTRDTIEWFENNGVPLKTEPDNRVFPQSDSSQSIVDCLVNKAESLGIFICLNTPVTNIKKKAGKFLLNHEIEADKIIVTTGGNPKKERFDWLQRLGHKIIPPVPSLFTFNMPSENIKELMGVVVKDAVVRIQKTSLKSTGSLLITHWGMSGPAILKLSAFGARILSEMKYLFKVQVNWTGESSEQQVRSDLDNMRGEKAGSRKMVKNNPFKLPNRLWEFLIRRANLRDDITWGEIGQKGINRLVNVLINDVYEVAGKTTFKEEFVTCGGVALECIDLRKMESKQCAGLFFAGEVLDIDGITGGFNFQAAWTTGFIAGKLGG